MPTTNETENCPTLPLTRIEKLHLRRQILDWRDEWLTQVSCQLTERFPALLRVLDAKIESISFTTTFKTKVFVEKQLKPVFAAWAETNATEILADAEKDLQRIYQRTLSYEGGTSAWSAEEASGKNAVEFGLASGSTGAAFLGIPLVASVSVQSAGYGLGLIGITAISWPIALGGAAILGTMAIFGGSRLARYKENAIWELKETTTQFVRASVLAPSTEPPSLCMSLQGSIRRTSEQLLEELKNV